MIFLQMRLVGENELELKYSYEQDKLRQEAIVWKEKYESINTKLQKSEERIKEYENATGDIGQIDSETEAELKKANTLLRIN